jgi:hypothetical protein
MTTTQQQFEMILKKLSQIEDQIKLFAGPHGTAAHVTPKKEHASKQAAPKGVGAGIQALIEEGFLSAPRLVSEIIGRLKQDGYFYRDSVVATKLLRMVKARDLTRLQEEGKWKYVTRK